MSAKNWKNKVSDLRNSEQIASFASKINQKVTSVFDVRQAMSTELLGIDIGPERIKVLKIDASVIPYKVVEYAIAPLPDGVIVKDEIKNVAAIGAALKGMLQQAGIGAKYAAVAIPRTLAIIKNITVDKRFNADDIESRAWIEANRLFPDLIGNIYLDFTITGPSTQVPDQLDLLMVACRKEHIKPYLEVMQIAGLEPQIVDVNCYALERALQVSVGNEADGSTIALLNVNLTQSSLIVMQKQQLIHAHDQSFDGQRLKKQVEEYVKTLQSQAGMENAPIIASDVAYRAILQEGFLSHLRHTVHFFYSSRSNISIDKIILAGDCATIPDFANFIELELGIKTHLAEPFTNMTISERLNADEIVRDAPSLMLCCGLALSSSGE